MNWNRWYRPIPYIRSSLWVAPFIAIVLEQIAIRVLALIDARRGWEIRHYGAENMQVARRLRAMGENLVRSLPAHRHAALHQQLALLDRELDRLYASPEDLALARIADAQGLVGASGTRI